MKKLWLIIGTLLGIFLMTGLGVGKELTTQEWLEDLEYAVSELKANHPHLYCRISREAFDTVVAQSRSSIENADSGLEAYYAIARVVASIQDGHTRLRESPHFELETPIFPFRLNAFSDGVFIIMVSETHREYLGAKVTRINGKPIEEALEITRSVIPMDNRFGRIPGSVNMISQAPNLVGLGLSDTEEWVELDLITTQNVSKKVRFDSVSDTFPWLWECKISMTPSKDDYINLETVLEEKTPLYLKHVGNEVKFYWFEHLKEEKILYFQFNQVADQPGHDESLIAFTDRLMKYLDDHEADIEKLVIDIRFNDGGDGRFLAPLINHIIKRDHINERGKLFILLGNRTYSAPVIFITELLVHTHAMFVGNPPASGLDFFSNQRIVGRLPNSGFQLGIASRLIFHAWPYHPDSFQPDIPVPLSSSAFFAGRDPLLEKVMPFSGE